jgi:hypothetical protein
LRKGGLALRRERLELRRGRLALRGELWADI